ncbi:MAG: hypothetical protein UY00_C0005G0005 [Candidatus Wolfebacteria bacterium GW2011_GWA1_47_6]|nr:MAG: hypothetical protein UY00_C0005G0005 [Candidatus Wolfebacteria bacterium GW2011_GWA1_47_6]
MGNKEQLSKKKDVVDRIARIEGSYSKMMTVASI